MFLVASVSEIRLILVRHVEVRPPSVRDNVGQNFPLMSHCLTTEGIRVYQVEDASAGTLGASSKRNN